MKNALAKLLDDFPPKLLRVLLNNPARVFRA
jgi:hypothetical protein